MDADRAKDVIGRRQVYVPAGEVGNDLLCRFRADFNMAKALTKGQTQPGVFVGTVTLGIQPT